MSALEEHFHRKPMEDVEKKEGEYGQYGKSTAIDLYVPQKGDAPFPVIVFVPGGAWSDCIKNLCLPHKLGFCQRGYVTASISYRTSSEATFPTQLEDLKSAIRWIRAHAGKHDIDPNRIGVMGTSAGGHLACLLGVTENARQFDVGKHRDQSSAVRCVCNFYGATDLSDIIEQLENEGGDPEYMREKVGNLLGGSPMEKADLAELASPIHYVDENSSAFLHVQGTADPWTPFRQTEIFHDKIRQHGVESRLHLVPDGGHGNDRLFSDEQWLEEVFRFFDEQLLQPVLKGETDGADVGFPARPRSGSSLVRTPDGGVSEQLRRRLD